MQVLFSNFSIFLLPQFYNARGQMESLICRATHFIKSLNEYTKTDIISKKQSSHVNALYRAVIKTKEMDVT